MKWILLLLLFLLVLGLAFSFIRKPPASPDAQTPDQPPEPDQAAEGENAGEKSE